MRGSGWRLRFAYICACVSATKQTKMKKKTKSLLFWHEDVRERDDRQSLHLHGERFCVYRLEVSLISDHHHHHHHLHSPQPGSSSTSSRPTDVLTDHNLNRLAFICTPAERFGLDRFLGSSLQRSISSRTVTQTVPKWGTGSVGYDSFHGGDGGREYVTKQKQQSNVEPAR